MGSLTLQPALLLCGNSRPRVAATPLPHATRVHGQFPGRDFNPLDGLLLLRTDRFIFLAAAGGFAAPIRPYRATLPGGHDGICVVAGSPDGMQ
jgi:hypothetical protein